MYDGLQLAAGQVAGHAVRVADAQGRDLGGSFRGKGAAVADGLSGSDLADGGDVSLQRHDRFQMNGSLRVVLIDLLRAVHANAEAGIVCLGQRGVVDAAQGVLAVNVSGVYASLLQFVLRLEECLDLALREFHVLFFAGVGNGQVGEHAGAVDMLQVIELDHGVVVVLGDADAVHAGVDGHVSQQFGVLVLGHGGFDHLAEDLVQLLRVFDAYERLGDLVAVQLHGKSGGGVTQDDDGALDAGFSELDGFGQRCDADVVDAELVELRRDLRGAVAVAVGFDHAHDARLRVKLLAQFFQVVLESRRIQLDPGSVHNFFLQNLYRMGDFALNYIICQWVWFYQPLAGVTPFDYN